MAPASMTRAPSPVRRGKAQIERRVEPLFDNAEVSSTTTGQVEFFQNPQGSAGKTQLDTNMRKAGSLPSPRLFQIRGFEIAVSQALTSRTAGIPATEAAAAGTPKPSDFLNGIKGLFWTAYLRFIVGTKDYVQAPLFLLPSNQGIDGSVFGAQVPNGTFATGLRVAIGQSVGMSWSVRQKPITLVPDQPIRGELVLPIAGAGQVAGAGKVVYMFLHGMHSVEVM